MADPASVIGVIGVAAQIIQLSVQFGLDWKEAPAEAKSFIHELQSLKNVLSETYTNIILNPDFAGAFAGRPSALLSQLGPLAHDTDTIAMVSACHSELQGLSRDLERRACGSRGGWERLKGAFESQRSRDAVETLHRQCLALNQLVAIDAVALAVNTNQQIKDVKRHSSSAPAPTAGYRSRRGAWVEQAS